MPNTEALKKQLELARRELNTYSYALSHDLRASIRSIDGFSRLLLNECGDNFNEDGRDYLGRITRANNLLSERLDKLIDIMRTAQSKMHIAPVNLSQMTATAIAKLQALEPDRVVQFEIKPDMTTHGDPHLLQLLMDILLDNAWKFTRRTPFPQISVGKSDATDSNTFYVQDNGAGFDMKYVEKLFCIFQRLHTEQEFPGHGTGLAKARGIVNAHLGEIRATGEIGNGATLYFTIDLPLC